VRIGVFGGSFDPIHHGHLIAAAALTEALALDEVRLVVARLQPLKGAGHAAAAEDRAAMVELAVRGDSRLRASRAELGREGPSYTVDTLRSFRAERPEAELVLLLGADAAAELPRWREADAVRALARVEVFSRDGGAGASGELRVPRVDISSTAIRALVRAGRSIRYWVPDAVAEYIAARRLYGEA
jgi:nicotinate-nucleotide adenylyltransferase